MKCPQCGAWSDVKETRPPRRRRECANGHRFTTIELLATDAAAYTAAETDKQNKYLRSKAKLIALGYLQPD